MKTIIATMIIVGCSLWAYSEPPIQTDEKRFLWGPPREIAGKVYVPKEYHHRKDLSDWSQLSLLHPSQIKSVRIHGFSKLSQGRSVKYHHIEETYQFSDLSEKTQNLLLFPACYRPPISDISEGGAQGGMGIYLGVLQFETHSGKKLVIGVSKVGFFLGVFYGGSHHMFFSEKLAEFTNRLVYKAGNYSLPHGTMQSLMPTSNHGMATVGSPLPKGEKEESK